jgi:hypothetical protein
VDAVIYQTGYSKQLQRAMDYDSPKALGITFVTPAIYTPSPNIQCYWSSCGSGDVNCYTTMPHPSAGRPVHWAAAAALAALSSPSCLSPRAIAPFRSSDSAAQPG